MSYDIYVNAEYKTTIYSLAKLVNYLNDNNLAITRESEYTKMNTIYVLCHKKED